MRIRHVGIATAAIAVGAVVASVALAAGIKTTVKVGLDPGPKGDAIAGKVKSEADACVSDRIVKVTYVDKSAGIKDVLGKDETDKKGRFSVDIPKDGGPYGEGGFAPPGKYTAKAKRARAEVHDETVTCKAGEGVYRHRG